MMKRFAVCGILMWIGLFGMISLAGAQNTDVVASGLNNPRSLAFGADGALYIAEAGVGGVGPCIDESEGQLCFGKSGSVTRVLNGVQTKWVTDLPSLAGEGGADSNGPSGVYAALSGDIYVLVGLGTAPENRSDPAMLNNASNRLGYLLHLPVDAPDHRFVDISAYEAAHNPDGGEVDSNPFAFTMDGDRFIVVDAGANDLLQVDAQGEISTLAVFPDTQVPTPSFLPQDSPTMPMQAVPDSIAIGPDGSYYVGQLTGFPFPVGGASIFRVVPGQQPEVFASGFTNIIDLQFDPDGNLYVLEIRKNSLLSDDLSGALYRMMPDGSKKLMMDAGLVSPTAMAFGPDGMLYICNNAVVAGGGEVIRVNPADLPLSGIDKDLWESLDD